jgi:hypothetical protein
MHHLALHASCIVLNDWGTTQLTSEIDVTLRHVTIFLAGNIPIIEIQGGTEKRENLKLAGL